MYIKRKQESGRSVTEIVMVLAIIGILSVVGVWGYLYAIRKHQMTDVVNELSKRAAMLDLKLARLRPKTTENINALLAQNSFKVHGYQLNFHAASDTTKGFVSEVTRLDGKPIHGAACRDMIRKMSKQQFISDVDFTVKDQMLQDGTIGDVNLRLNGKVVNLRAVCGS